MIVHSPGRIKGWSSFSPPEVWKSISSMVAAVIFRQIYRKVKSMDMGSSFGTVPTDTKSLFAAIIRHLPKDNWRELEVIFRQLPTDHFANNAAIFRQIFFWKWIILSATTCWRVWIVLIEFFLLPRVSDCSEKAEIENPLTYVFTEEAKYKVWVGLDFGLG